MTRYAYIENNKIKEFVYYDDSSTIEVASHLLPVRVVDETDSDNYLYDTTGPEYTITSTEVLEKFTSNLKPNAADLISMWVDTWAENKRGGIVSNNSGQILEYASKLEEAREVQRAMLAGEPLNINNFPFLKWAEGATTTNTLIATAESILAAYNRWVVDGALIASVRSKIKQQLSVCANIDEKVSLYKTTDLDYELAKIQNEYNMQEFSGPNTLV